MATPFLRNHWYCAAWSREIKREPLGRVFLGEPVVMYRREDGVAVAMEDTCPHRRAPMHKGKLVGDSIQCPYHGIIFDCTGKATWAQAQDKLPAKMCLGTYKLVERDGWAWIWMGDPELADESKIFPAPTCQQAGWAVTGGHYMVKAAIGLAIDNLMDLSHTAFVHMASAGAENDLNPEKLIWERGDNWVKGTRVAHGNEPAPYQRNLGGVTWKLDQTKEMKWTAPHNCNVNIFTTDAGVELGKGRWKEEFLTFNLLTPETENSFHYFWANTVNIFVDNAEFQANLQKFGEQLICEDKWILEETQIATALHPRPEIDLIADAGGVQVRRMFKAMLDAQNQKSAASAAR